MSATTPLEIGPYVGRRQLGGGAGGEVWLADGADGPVALKVARSVSQREVLRSEAATMSRLSHRNVVRLIDSDDAGAWLAMELINGASLDVWARGRAVSSIVDVAAELADAIAHLHDCGLVHGDLKPQNVLVDRDGRPTLIDLGLTQHTAQRIAGGNFQGTYGYAAPELLKQGERGHTVDLYALGAVTYHMLTGRLPFTTRDPAALAWLPMTTLPEPPSSRRPRTPAALDDLVLRLLARDASQRPGPASALAEAFRDTLRSSPASPVVGMRKEREVLRRAVVAATSGTPGVVVLHGPRGSGRRTLIRECVQHARREGLAVVDSAETGKSFMQTLRSSPDVLVVPLDGNRKISVRVAEKILREALPVLALLRADQPVLSLQRLGARHMVPPPLRQRDLALLLHAYVQEPSRAGELHEATRGLPSAVRAHLRTRRVDVPQDLDAAERELLTATTSGPVRISVLATLMGLSEHGVVDVAESLLDRGVLVEADEGAAFAMASPI